MFSAGEMEVLDRLKDGRILIEVKMEGRYQLGDQIQALPFSIYRCQPYTDLGHELDRDADILRVRVMSRLQQLAYRRNDLADLFNSPEWCRKSDLAFSFAVFSLLNLSADQAQIYLEMTSMGERLKAVLQLLNQMLKCRMKV